MCTIYFVPSYLHALVCEVGNLEGAHQAQQFSLTPLSAQLARQPSCQPGSDGQCPHTSNGYLRGLQEPAKQPSLAAGYLRGHPPPQYARQAVVESLQHVWSARCSSKRCSRYYCPCWLASEVSVRSLKTLCTCGLGGALLNICKAWLRAQAQSKSRFANF